jgi:DNA-binding MarR family transcriptional regulator
VVAGLVALISSIVPVVRHVARRETWRVTRDCTIEISRLVVYIDQLWNYVLMTSSATADRGAAGEAVAGLGADLLAVVARLNRYATQRIQMQLPAAQARLLSTIDAQVEARICDLAAVDHCSQPTMTTQVRRLEDAGLVTRAVDPCDARAVRIRITPEGMRTLNRVRADRAAVIEPQLAKLESADRQALVDAVAVLRRLLEDAAPAPRPGASR